MQGVWRRGLLLFCILAGMPGAAAASSADCPPFDQEHAAWTTLLSRYVVGREVDYTGWKRDGVPPLQVVLDGLASVSAPCFARFSPDQQVAFLLNAYNAATVALILENHPIRSIREIGLLPGAAFRKTFITLPAAGPSRLSLDDIEHETLRKRYREPRVHFALVCASRSCPALRAEAYRGSVLSAQLDDQARHFLGDPTKNRFDEATGTLQLSQIFDWFPEDFERAAGSVPRFLAPFLSGAAAEAALGPNPRIEFLAYDWSLNGR